MIKLIILSVCSFIAAASVNFTEKTIYPLQLREEIRVVPKKEILDLLCLDHRGFASDVLFIKVNLHSGSLMWKPLKFKFDSQWCYSIMDLVTDLDPKYYTAYLFSAMGLIHRFDDVKRARKIVEKGMEVFPESWELPFWIGYDYYVYFEDYDVAGEYLWKSSQKPGSPKRHLSLMLSALRNKGDYEKALVVLQTLFEETEEERLKTVYGKKLIQLKNLAILQNAVRMYQKYRGRLPPDLNELVRERMISNLPEDPYGMQYDLDREKGRVVMKKAER